MNEKTSKFSKAAIAFMIVAAVLTALSIAAAIVFQYSIDGKEMWNNLFTQLKCMGEAFVFPFKKDATSTLWAGTFEHAGIQCLAVTISVYAACALTLAAVIAGIIVSVKKKKGVFNAFIVVMVLALFMTVFTLANGAQDYSIIKVAAKGASVKPLILSFAILALVLPVLAFAFTIVAYFTALAGKKETVEEVAAEVTEVGEPVLAEEAVDPECVQESEEIGTFETTTDDFIPVVEPEPEQEVTEQPAELAEEPAAEPVAEPAPEEEKKVEVNVNTNATAPAGVDTNSLATMLREVVRDIVRDELARNTVNQPAAQNAAPVGSTQQITGATFGGPLVVQYFNGGINGVTPAQPVVAPAPAPVAEPAPAPAPAPVEEPAPAPAPVAEPAPAPVAVVAPVVEEPKKEEKVYERLTFGERLLQSEKDVQNLYNELKNEILSYGVKSRVSAVGDTFRLHKKMYVRITVAGKSLKLYFALDPKDYENSTIPVQDASGKALYEEIPLVFKVKSDLSVRRAKELIQATMEKDSLEQGEVGKVNWIKELKAEMAAGNKDND